MATIPHRDSTRVVFSTVLVVLMFVASCMPFLKVPCTKPNRVQALVTLPRPADASCSSDQYGDEWPMLRGGLIHAGVATTVPVQGAGPTWSYATSQDGSMHTSPTVAGGLVYVGSSDDNVYCLNATTGAFVWNYTTGGCVWSTPAIAGGRVYVGSFDDKVYCLNAITGAFIWSHTTGGLVWSSPVVANGRVYVGSDDQKIYCLNATTGGFVWSFTTNGSVGSSPAVVGGRVYVGSNDYKVYCLNATTGSFIWSYTTGYDVVSSPAVVDGRVYVRSNNYKVYCLNATTGSFIWSYTTMGYDVYSSPAVAGGRVYVGGSRDCNVYCLNAVTGLSIWNYTTGSGVFGRMSSPAVAAENLYVGGPDNKTYCLNANTGAFIWSYYVGNYSDYIVDSSPTIADGHVYVEGNTTYCLPMILGTTVPSPPRAARYTEFSGVFKLHGQVFNNPIHLTINITYGDWPVQQAWCVVDNSTVYVLARSNGTATWGFYAVDVNLTAGSHALAFFVTDTGNHTISQTLTITVIMVTPASSDPTIIVIIVIIIGISVGVAVPLSYSRYKQKIYQKKQIASKTSTKAKQMPGVNAGSPHEVDKRASLLKTSMPVAYSDKLYTGEKVGQRCILHKGMIMGPSYRCKACGAIYCVACINQMIDTGEHCWNCGSAIDASSIYDSKEPFVLDNAQ